SAPGKGGCRDVVDAPKLTAHLSRAFQGLSNPLPETAVGVSIAENFEVHASAERVWEYLTDPRQVVECLPGAELLEVEGERTFVGRMRVKVGPVTAAFRGRARF